MNAFATDLRELVAKHISAAPSYALMELVDALATNGAAVPIPMTAAQPASTRFSNLDEDGTLTEDEHVAVYQYATELIWTAAPLRDGKELTHAEAVKAAADLRLLGKSDWRLPTIQELLSIVDYARCDPAVDPKHFKGPYSWTWSSTIAAAPAGCAWVVYLNGGYSNRFHQDYHFLALAVRAGQQLGLSV